jgi:uncharacterized membrane protein
MADSLFKKGARILLGLMLIFAGIGHLSFARQEFQAQVPDWVPLDKDTTVVLSGYVEILLGALLVFTPKRYRPALGLLVALFFIAVFPGNLSQYLNQRDGFGLNSDTSRLIRLFFQPVLVYWAYKSTREPDA